MLTVAQTQWVYEFSQGPRQICVAHRPMGGDGDQRMEEPIERPPSTSRTMPVM
jgi:hypothetical protein